MPVGESRPRYCNVRVIAATNHDLAPLIEASRFRHDLYYRLNIIRIELPPLRERPGDIPRLAEYFLRQIAAHYGKHQLTLSPEAIELLRGHSYPGNIRELENAIRRAVILARDDLITPSLLPAEFRTKAMASSVPECGLNFHTARGMAIRSFEQAYLATALRTCGGIVSRAARKTGLSERNFYKKLALYGIDYRDYRS
jgi:DNA-binding NtrC family response regulator